MCSDDLRESVAPRKLQAETVGIQRDNKYHET